MTLFEDGAWRELLRCTCAVGGASFPYTKPHTHHSRILKPCDLETKKLIIQKIISDSLQIKKIIIKKSLITHNVYKEGSSAF